MDAPTVVGKSTPEVPGEFLAFLRALDQVIDFGVDQPAHYEPAGSASKPLDKKQFFEELYEERGVTKQLLTALRSSSRLICLVGPRGSGKTTVIHKMKQDAEPENRHQIVLLIDIREQIRIGSIDASDADAIGASLRRMLRDYYLNQFFQSSRDPDNDRLNLYAFLLDSSQRKLLHRQPEDILRDPIFELQDDVDLLLQRHDAGEKGPRMTIRDWLLQAIADREVQDLKRRVNKDVTFSQLVYSAKEIKGINDQIIWFDNVDALTDQQQTNAMGAITNIFAPVSSLVRMGLSIREENVFREYEQGAPPKHTRIMLKIPRDREEHAYYPDPMAHDVPLANYDILKGVMAKRLSFVGKLQAGSAIPEALFNKMAALTDRLVNLICKENAIFLVNNSLRDFMQIVRDCLGDMVKPHGVATLGDRIDRATQYDDCYIRTLFFWRVRYSQRSYRIGVYDVLAAVSEFYKGFQVGPGCMLEHLILTATWNLTLKDDGSGGGGRPVVGDVVDRLAMLGYTRDQIIKTMYGLYLSPKEGRQNLLEIRTRDMLTGSNQIRDDLRIYLTPRGKCLAASSGGSFAYLYGCLRRLERVTAEQEFVDEREIRSTDKVIDRLLPHLCDIAQMHYKTLRTWRETKTFGGEHWLDRYKAEFGVPEAAVLTECDTGKRLLQLEMILARLYGYPKHQPGQREKLRKLQQEFLAATARMNDAQDWGTGPEPDFKKLVGI
jgi:energy-coupling factor transporter ATP-binding protein EcfA2